VLRATGTNFFLFFRRPLRKQDKRACLNDLLALLGNLLYRNSSAQDSFRELHGFALVLPHCATNLHSPFTREWAFLCIRNACEGNELSQQYAASLQPLPNTVVLKDEEMQRAGLEVEVDPVTKKFVVKQPQV